MTVYLSPTPAISYLDNNGALLSGGKLFIYTAGTTTKAIPYTDSTGLVALPNPIILNTRGEVAASATGTTTGLWLDPTQNYKFVLSPSTDSDPPTNPFWTIDNIAFPPGTSTTVAGGIAVGSQVSYGGTTAPNGWLLCYGQAVSRSTYALLFAAIGTAYGSGDGSSTFNVPDKRGRISVGADNMGGSAANRVTNAVSGVNASTVGAAGGNQLAQRDTITISNSVTIADSGHVHTTYNQQVRAAGTGNFWNALMEGTNASSGGAGTNPSNTDTGGMMSATTGITVAVTSTGTSSLTGTSQNMPPVQVDNWIIYTGYYTGGATSGGFISAVDPNYFVVSGGTLTLANPVTGIINQSGTNGIIVDNGGLIVTAGGLDVGAGGITATGPIAFSQGTTSDVAAISMPVDITGSLVLSGELFLASPTITATGTVQGTAYTLTEPLTIITGGAAGTGVLVPTGNGGQFTIMNRSGSSKNVWPHSGAQLESAGINTAVTLANGANLTVTYTSSTQGYYR